MKFNIKVFVPSLLFLSSIAVALPAPAPQKDLTMRSEAGLTQLGHSVHTPLEAREYVERDGILEGTATILLQSLENLADQLLEAAKKGAQISEALFKTLDGLVTTLVNLGIDIPAGILDKIQEIRDILENRH